MIKIDNITFSYIKINIVFTDYSLEIGKGLTYLSGANGVGKSTLIKLIMGILRPNGGRIIIDGMDIKGKRLSELGRINGYLFQNPDIMLFANSVYEELAFPMELQGIDRTIIDNKAQEAMKLFGLSGRGEEFPLTLSMGEKQRLALATIFMREPDRYFLDEPTSRLDTSMKRELIVLINNLLDMGKDVIIATHDSELIDNLNGRIIELVKL